MQRTMKRLLIAGAGGGIGLALVDALAARAEVERVYALHRRPVSSTSSRITWLSADLACRSEVDSAVSQIRTEGPLDGLIVSTGLLHQGTMQPEKSLDDLDAQRLLDLYTANAVGPLMLLRSCRHLFRGSETPFICFLSAQVGSIGDNRLGGWYGYRMAKAALNMAVKTASIELARDRTAPTVVAVHPGTTDTALSHRYTRRRRQPVSTPKQCAGRLLTLLESLPVHQNGSFLNYDGTTLPW